MNKLFRDSRVRGVLYGIVALVLVHLTGTLGYMYIGRPTATWIDSFYMTFITVATIGYGEVVDLSTHPMGRLFTVFIAAVGIVSMSYLFSSFVALLLESDLNTALRKKRMEKAIAKLSGHYIMCGIGRVGTNVAHELTHSGHPLVVIESNRDALDRWLEHHPDTLYLHDDAADDDALRTAGVLNAAGVFAVTGDDSHNLMVSLSVKLLNPKARVVARLHDIRNADKARRAGADEVVSPDYAGGMRIASAMVSPHVVNFMDQMLHADDGMRVEEILVPPQFTATPLTRLIPKSRDYMLLALQERGKWVFNPADDHVLTAGSTLILMASPGSRAQLEARLNG